MVEIAATQPQAAYSALVKSIQNRWMYISRTTENIGYLLQPIEDILRHELIPAITGRQAISDAERRMFALPTRLGGLGIDILPELADRLHSSARKVTEPLKNSICSRVEMDEIQIESEQIRISKEVKNDNKVEQRRKAEAVCKDLGTSERKAISRREGLIIMVESSSS